MEKIEKLFGRTVRALRERKGLSQEDFADHAGIHRTYVSSVELGKVQVSIRIAQQLAVALEIPLSHLFREVEKEMARPKTTAKGDSA